MFEAHFMISFIIPLPFGFKIFYHNYCKPCLQSYGVLNVRWLESKRRDIVESIHWKEGEYTWVPKTASFGQDA